MPERINVCRFEEWRFNRTLEMRNTSYLTKLFYPGYIPLMAWDVEYTDDFGEWWNTLTEEEQEDVAAIVGLLEAKGHTLPYPYSSDVKISKVGQMRELRVQHKGKPYRVLYAFDPRRTAILLIGGKKTGDEKWYNKMIPIADRLFTEHLKILKKEDKNYD